MRLAAEAAAPLTEGDVADLCAGFQSAVTAVLAKRSADALARFKAELPGAPPVLVVAGGVAANRTIAAALEAIAVDAGARLVVPPLALCTDNGAMIAWAGAERFILGARDGLGFTARARWLLQDEDMRLHHGA